MDIRRPAWYTKKGALNMEKSDGGPAFPTDAPAQVGHYLYSHKGMSFRAYIATAAAAPTTRKETA